MKTIRFLVLIVFMFVQFSCSSLPRVLWHEEDVLLQQIRMDAREKLLIASRKSDFKEAVIAKIVAYYQADSIAIKVIGLEDLAQETATDYQSIILINTCMTWNIDRNVNAFLAENPDIENVVILTTSGHGHWLPKKRERQFDAISSASQIADVEQISAEIVQKINEDLR